MSQAFQQLTTYLVSNAKTNSKGGGSGSAGAGAANKSLNKGGRSLGDERNVENRKRCCES